MRTPDAHSRIELSRFDAPAIEPDHRTASVNSLGYLRVMFAVENLDHTLARLSKLGATVSMKLSIIGMSIGSATSEDPKEFSSIFPNDLGSRAWEGSRG